MKILALHGYTQSGPGFQRKIQRLQLHLEEAFPSASFCFPTGPVQLRLSDQVGIRRSQMDRDKDAAASIELSESLDKADPDYIDSYAWFALHDYRDPPTGYLQSLDMLANIFKTEGPFDGVLAFSQGCVIAAMVASLLEGTARREAFARAAETFADALPYPKSFIDLDHPPLKFGITYGALMAPGKKYAAFYDKPRIQTPFCHFTGQWDPVVSTEMTQAVENAQIGGSGSIRIVHPGAHFVPIELQYLNAVVDFIQGLDRNSVSMSEEGAGLQQGFEQRYTLLIRRLPIKSIVPQEDIDSWIDDLHLDSAYSMPGYSRQIGYRNDNNNNKTLKQKRSRSKIIHATRATISKRAHKARFLVPTSSGEISVADFEAFRKIYGASSKPHQRYFIETLPGSLDFDSLTESDEMLQGHQSRLVDRVDSTDAVEDPDSDINAASLYPVKTLQAFQGKNMNMGKWLQLVAICHLYYLICLLLGWR